MAEPKQEYLVGYTVCYGCGERLERISEVVYGFCARCEKAVLRLIRESK